MALLIPNPTPNHPTLKLGRKPHKVDHRDLLFADYLVQSTLPDIPNSYQWSKPITSWPMFLNNKIGCCTIAGPGHQIQLWTALNNPIPTVLLDDQIQEAYVAVTGEEGAAYNPTTGANDNGCAISDVLEYWRTTGIGGHKIAAYVKVNVKNQLHITAANYIFGSLDTGVELPLCVQNMTDSWYIPKDNSLGSTVPGSWGGHCVPAVDYDLNNIWIISWGKRIAVTWEFFYTYFDEAWAAISNDWIAANGKNPLGIDLPTMSQDLYAVTGDTLPLAV